MSRRIEWHSGRFWEGRTGTAHEVIVDRPDTSDATATLGAWFLRCPHQSIGWECYVLSVIHLRPIPKVRPAVIRAPGATHELIIIALDPDKDPSPDPTTWHHLVPINLMEQFQVPTDADAVELLDASVRAVLDGELWAEPPLSGQVEPWRTVIIKTSAHARGEEHAP